MTPLQARALVSTIDLKAICQKVRVQQKWDADTVARAEWEYREYLAAALANPVFSAPPSRTADEIWHAHILDTAKYAADCERVFGGMLHHVPNYEPYLTPAVEADAALCFNQREEKRDAALCFAQKQNPANAALCFAQKAEQPQDAALCFATREGPADAALCFARRDGAVTRKVTPRRANRRSRRVLRTRV